MKYLNALLVATVSTLSSPILAGSFIGDPVLFPKGCQLIANQDDHDKKCRLKGELTYISSRNNLVWQTDEWKNSNGNKIFSGLTDGASIPSWARKIIGDKYDKSYLKAAIVHDHYCYDENHVRTWQETHKMFYDALIDLKVDKTKAKAMYFAVYVGGPKWRRDKIVAGESCSGDYGSRCTKLKNNESIEDSLSDEELEEHIRIGRIWDEWDADEQYDGTYLEYLREKYPEEYFSDARIEDNFLGYVSINKSEKNLKDKKLEKSYLNYLNDKQSQNSLSINHHLRNYVFTKKLEKYLVESFKTEKPIIEQFVIDEQIRQSLYAKELEQLKQSLRDEELEETLSAKEQEQLEEALNAKQQLEEALNAKKQEQLEKYFRDEDIEEALSVKEQEQLEESLSAKQTEQSPISRIDWQEANYGTDEFNKQILEVQKIIENDPEITLEELERIAHYRSPIS